MSGEGDGGPTRPGSWRRRRSLGLLALAALGVALAARGQAVHLRAGAGMLAWFELGGATGLARAALGRARRRPSRASPVASPWPERRPRRSRLPPPRPGPSRELLALFATPRAGAAEAGTEVAAVRPRDPPRDADEPPASGATPRLIRLYGPLAVEGVEARPLRRPAVRGLIAYLVLRRGPASLDELAEALWPGESASRGRARLHQAKCHAQLALGAALARDGDGYTLDLAGLSLDADLVERATATAVTRNELEHAVALSRGEPLADVDYPFAEGERRRLQAIRRELLARVSQDRLAVADARGALAAAEELIALDPLDELGWRLAMQAEAGLGARQAVVVRYRALEHELDRVLGLRPQAETRAAFRRLLGQR